MKIPPIDEEQEPFLLRNPLKKRKRYTIEYKMRIVEEVKNHGISSVLIRYDLNRSLIYKWLKLYPKMQLISKSKRKYTHLHQGGKPILFNFEWEILNWIKYLRELRIPVSGFLTKIKALQLAKSHEIKDFKASSRWFQRFKKRNNLSFRKGVKRSSKISSKLLEELNDFQKTVYHKILFENFEFIINIDETPVFYNLCHDRTLTQKGSKEVLLNGYQNKKRVTVILGIIYSLSKEKTISKLKPMIIFKGKTSRVLKNHSSEHCLLSFNQKAWCTINEFLNFLSNSIPLSLRNKKIIFIWDNFSVHNSSDVQNFLKKFFPNSTVIPPNSTAYSQPLDVCQ